MEVSQKEMEDPSKMDQANAHIERRQHWLDSTRLWIARDVTLAVLLTGALGLGMMEVVVVANDSIWYSLAGFAIGAIVQVALFPLANLVRLLCQLWFTRQLVKEGMHAENVLAAWSALYSGSFRGIEDIMSGARNPIVILLIAFFCLEAVVIGAIGNLYEIRTTQTTKATGMWRDLSWDTFPVDVDVGEVLDSCQGNLFSGLCADLYQNGMIPDSPLVECSEDGQICQGSGHVAIYPMSTSTYGYPYTFPFTSLLSGDTVTAEVMSAKVNITCDSSTEFAIETMDTESWMYGETLVNATVNGTSYYSTGQTYGRYGVIYGSNDTRRVEIGTLPFDTLIGDDFSFVLFAKNFQQPLRGFQPIFDPTIGSNLQLTYCTIQVGTARADIETEVVFTTPSLITELKSYSAIEPYVKIDVTAPEQTAKDNTDGFSPLYVRFSCYFWYCPNFGDGIPSYDSQCGLLQKSPSFTDNFDWDGQIEQTISALVRSNLMVFAGYALIGSQSSNGTAPATVKTFQGYSKLVTSSSCNILLLFGVIASVLLVILTTIKDYCGRRWPTIDRGMNMTDSVYGLLAAFDSRFLNASASSSQEDNIPEVGDGDLNPDAVKNQLRGKNLQLGMRMLHRRRGADGILEGDAERASLSRNADINEVEEGRAKKRVTKNASAGDVLDRKRTVMSRSVVLEDHEDM
ncbi:hypothetical protein HKX48_006207 [Thoreauomyces humboldtii]|nr:hypothetical protein HKX48_006207 [Thoreauomyces humboldtii]